MATSHKTDHRRATAVRNVEAILSAAETLLAGGGAATTSAVAAAAGVSRVTVYAHFPTREALLEAIVERAVRQTASTVAELRLDEGPPADALERLVRATWQELHRNRTIAQSAAEGLSAAAMRRAHDAMRGPIEALVRRGQQQGAFRGDLSPRWCASSFLALAHTCADEVRGGSLAADDAVATLSPTVAALVRPRAQGQITG